MRRNPSSPCRNPGSQIIPFMCPVKDCSTMSERSVSSSSADTRLLISGHWLSRDVNEMSLPGYSCMLFPLYQQRKKGRSGFSGFPAVTSKPGIKPRSQPVPEQRVLKCQEVIPEVPGALLWHHPPPWTVIQTEGAVSIKKMYSPGNDREWDGWLSRENALLEISHRGEHWGHSSSAVCLAPSVIEMKHAVNKEEKTFFAKNTFSSLIIPSSLRRLQDLRHPCKTFRSGCASYLFVSPTGAFKND